MNFQSFQQNPLSYIDSLFYQDLISNSKSNHNYEFNFTKTLQELIETNINKEKIIDFQDLRSYQDLQEKNGYLIKVKCMVQNIFDPEIYASTLVLNNNWDSHNVTNQVLNMKYRDFYENPILNNISIEDKAILQERLAVYSVGIPGNNIKNNNKRYSLENKFNDLKIENDIQFKGIQISKNSDFEYYIQELKKEKIWNSLDNNQFPLIIKFYDDQINKIKINEIIEVYGILSYNINEDNEKYTDNNYSEEKNAYPHCLIPRLHCLYFNNLSEIEENLIFEDKETDFSCFFNFFNQFFNDSLLTKYIFYTLINNQTKLKENEDFNKIILNIYDCSEYKFQTSKNIYNFPEFLNLLISKITKRNLYIPISIQKLENELFFPSKNYENNTLETGIFQIPQNTTIIIDETTMNVGTLTEKGIKNLQKINDFIENQKISFDFSYHLTRLDTNCNCIIISDGKSFLKSNFNIPLKSEKLEKITFIPQEIENMLENNNFFDKIDNYLTKIKINLEKLVFPENLVSFIEEDYINERKNNNNNGIDSEKLHKWLIIAKIIAISEFSSELKKEHYLEAKKIENERNLRIKK